MPTEAQVLEGDTLRLLARVLYADGTEDSDVPVEWRAKDTLAVLITAPGLLYGRAPGVDTLLVSYSGIETRVPVQVTGMSGGWRELGMNCGAWENGLSYCWQWSLLPATDIKPPVIAPLPAVGQVRYGSRHTCGIVPGGQAYCWGENDYGQLGDGRTLDSATPVPVAGGFSFDSIAVGALHTCGITSDGQAYCWGAGKVGQLGVGAPPESCDGMPCSRQPIAVTTTERFRAIAAGGQDVTGPNSNGIGVTCALTESGTPLCWGYNSLRTIGDGSRINRTVPTRVTTTESYVAIAVGEVHVCGLTANGTAQCWGANSYGQLGTILSSGSSNECAQSDAVDPCSGIPVTVSGSERFRALSTGPDYTCALNAMGAAYCWGMNRVGELGATTPLRVFAPTRVSGGFTFLDLKSGTSSSCALTPTRTIQCWGNGTPHLQPVADPAPRQ